MKVLVTGGAGYVGSISARLLADEGHDVVVLDTLEKGRAKALDPRATFVQGSVGDAEVVARAIGEGCDAVLHAAGYIEVAESVAEPGKYVENNVAAPLVLLDVMRARGVDAIVFSSTAAVYGEPESTPVPEDAPLRPVNPYGMSKLMFEQVLESYGRAHGLRSVRFRYFNVAGAWPDGSLGESHDPETHIIPRILGAMAEGEREFEVFGGDYPTRDGTCVRDYIHACDLARAHLAGLEALVAGGEGGVFNLANGQGYSNLEVVRTCSEVTGVDVDVTIGPRRPGDPAVLVATAERAEAHLGWAPQHTELREIIGHAWKWHSEHPGGWGF